MNVPPEEFQGWLIHLGGLNRYDEPLFRIWWSQYGHGDGSYRAGGIWTVDEAHYIGYRDLLRGDGTPCWCLGLWHDAAEYGTPESYYVQHYDETSGLSILGEYPYSGRVELLYHLKYWYREDDRLVIERIPLNRQVFEFLIPILMMARNISWEKTKTAHQELLRREEEEKLRMIESHLHDNAVPFGGSSVSFTRQGVRSTEIDRRMLEMQRLWNDLQQSARSFRPGLSTRS